MSLSRVEVLPLNATEQLAALAGPRTIAVAVRWQTIGAVYQGRTPWTLRGYPFAVQWYMESADPSGAATITPEEAWQIASNVRNMDRLGYYTLVLAYDYGMGSVAKALAREIGNAIPSVESLPPSEDAVDPHTARALRDAFERMDGRR